MSVEKMKSSGEKKPQIQPVGTWLKSRRKYQKGKLKKKKKQNTERKNCTYKRQSLGTKKPSSYKKEAVGLLLKWRKGNR